MEPTLSEVLDQNRIPTGTNCDRIPYFEQGLVDCSIAIFGHILQGGDQRWRLVNQWNTLLQKKDTAPRGVALECALSSIHLSKDPDQLSYRNRYACYASFENLRQLARAMINLGEYPNLQDRFTLVEPYNDFSFELDRTDRINRGRNNEGITGCPEALYQMRLRYEEQYLGRLGFNVHYEDETQVYSVTNLQGIPHGDETYAYLDIDPFKLLIDRFQTLLGDTMAEPYDIRGIKNPLVHPALYNTVFKRMGIPRVDAPKIGRYRPDHLVAKTSGQYEV